MNRRNLMQTAAAGLSGLWVRQHAQAFETEPAATPAKIAPAARVVLPMNRNWLYGGKVMPGSSRADFDDSKFQHVTLPHTNKLLPWHSFDEKAFQFVSIYRRHFRTPAGLRGRRIFVDFAGVMTAATVSLNGEKLGEYRGGYTPFSFELTKHLQWDGDNVLAVEVDSTERADIPPFGGQIDYLTFGGIYREVSLRAVPDIYLENIFAKPVDVLTDGRRLDVKCYLSKPTGAAPAALQLRVELRDGDKVLASGSHDIKPSAEGGAHVVSLTNLGSIELWDLEHPRLYSVTVRLYDGQKQVDEDSRRIGFREARFTPDGFQLNGNTVKLRGLNRHQTFPWVGGAMPARVQRRDAQILRQELKCNLVRTSHYPQSPHFLDCCDEVGLLVLEEIPGWQHIGDQAWQDLSVRNVGEMIRRDWNHPCIILWGVRINESLDNHDFYTRTNALAHELDDSRQTGGIRYLEHSELLEDVYTRNDFGFPLMAPSHPLYLNTEFNGHMFPTKRYDNVDRVMEHARRHARAHDQLASDKRYAGGIGWCAFDYNTHWNFGSGDRICYHGVSDIFRIPKPAAFFYRSQCDPREEVVLEPCFNWSQGDQSEGGGVRKATICSNCDHLRIYLKGELLTEADPDRQTYAHLRYPAFIVDLLPSHSLESWGDLRIDGYINGEKVISKTLPGNDTDHELRVEPDDQELVGDGIDATRVVLQVTNAEGGWRPFSSAAVALKIEGPGEIVGENPFSLSGGVGAVWVKATEAAGTIHLQARHPYLPTRTVKIQVKPAKPELV
ncbi:MAG TPA: glycoside hydrolase family 2 TIM barrel-domain containing protein [Terriglobia bacterium]|nr:glycoside hydrolase family 2 TIM barrel-domain containing protein [Terriglobia bacterium]